MIKKFGNYESTKAYGNFEALPRGAYVLEILNAEVGENQYGQYVKISCDIAEGEHKDFYRNDYKNQTGEEKKWHCNYLLNVAKGDGTERDEWTARRFKTVIAAIEDSNQGYHFDWDEKKLKGLTIGVLFRNKEWEWNGKTGWTTECCAVTDADEIRKESFTIPKDKPLANHATAAAATGTGAGNNSEFDTITDDDDLPF